MQEAEPSIDRLAIMLKALSNPVRLEIFQTLTGCGEANCIDFTRHADLAQSTISEHLKVLKDSGLIRQCGPGLRSGYCINHEAANWMKQAVIGLVGEQQTMSPIRVLFLCTGNSARSIIAEAVLKRASQGDFEVYSAGTEPKGLNPFTLKVLEQAGLSTAGLESKDMAPFVDERFDYVITVCDRAAERCPTFPGDPERIHWSFTDPAAVEGSDVVKLAAFQETLRDMRQRVDLFAIVARRDAAAKVRA